MFDRDESAYLDDVDVSADLHRFEGDPYLTLYLVKCFNPEFKIRMISPKEKPFMRQARCISWDSRSFSSEKGVI